MINIEQIVSFIDGSNIESIDSVLYKFNFIINDQDDLNIIQYLYDRECFNQIYGSSGENTSLSELTIGDNVSKIEFQIYHLKKIGYFVLFDDFVSYCQTSGFPDEYYVRDINSFHYSKNTEINKLDFVVKYVDTLSMISNYKSNDKKTLCISTNNQLEELPIIYTSNDIRLMPSNDDFFLEILNTLSNTKNVSSKLYLKELIDFVSDVHPPKLRFST